MLNSLENPNHPHKPLMIFTEAITIVRAVEAHLLSETESNFLPFDNSKRFVYLSVKFLKMGINKKLESVFIWAALSLSIIILGRWGISRFGVQNAQAADIVTLVAMIVPTFLVVFPLPSFYGHCGVSPKTVDFVIEHLQAHKFSCVKDVELLKKSVKLFEDRCRSHVYILKGLVGLLWACFTYIVSKGIERSTTNPAELMSSAFMLALLIFGVIVAYVCVWGYDAALEKLFRAIEFGCNDYCHIIETPLQNEG